MNLKEFINYRFKCPLCDSPLAMSFHSKKWQNMKYEGDRMNIMFRMDKMNRSRKPYKIIYSFALNDNSFYIDFLSKEEQPFENEAPKHLMVRFRELDKNLKSYRFYKDCASCGCYMYSSNRFNLDFKKAVVHDLYIQDEYFGLSTPTTNGYRVFKLTNNYALNQSTLIYGTEVSDVWKRSDSNCHDMDMLRLSLLKFSSKDEMIDRLKKLLVFS